MSRYLLDTNIISDVVRNPGGKAERKLRSMHGDEIGTSVIVKGEIVYGLKKNGSVRGRERLDRLLSAIPVWPLKEPAEEIYGDIRNQLRAAGAGIGPNDLWIAAHALAVGAVLVTANEGEFSRISGLKIENWLATAE